VGFTSTTATTDGAATRLPLIKYGGARSKSSVVLMTQRSKKKKTDDIWVDVTETSGEVVWQRKRFALCAINILKFVTSARDSGQRRYEVYLARSTTNRNCFANDRCSMLTTHHNPTPNPNSTNNCTKTVNQSSSNLASFFRRSPSFSTRKYI
jgi:cellulose synthase/poly-beta-1,6-N-acetylglucosamine synthase-like glycosyltransferase